MNDLLHKLKDLYEQDYRRSIFNFYVKTPDNMDLVDLLDRINDQIDSTNSWDDLWNLDYLSQDIQIYFKKMIMGINRCLPNKTQIFRNPEYLQKPDQKIYLNQDQTFKVCPNPKSKNQNKMLNYLTFCKISPGKYQGRLIHWILTQKNPITGYLRTINKKNKNKYTELHKVVLNKPVYQPFSGILENELQENHIISKSQTPWIKQYKTFLRIKLDRDKIISGGRTGLAQSIDITLTNKTCIILFKNGTIHVLLSKPESESFKDFLNIILETLEFLAIMTWVFQKDPSKTKNDLLTFSQDLRIYREKENDDQINFGLSLFVEDYYPMNTIESGILNLILTGLDLSKEEMNIFKEININKQIRLYKTNQINFTAIRNKDDLNKNLDHFKDLVSTVKEKIKFQKINPFFEDFPDFD